METVEFLSLAFSLACFLGPAIGALTLIIYQIIVWLGREGFVIQVGFRPHQQEEKERPYEWR